MWKLPKNIRREKIDPILETRAGGTEMWLETASRGNRRLTLDLSIDEIEDILKAEDARRRANSGTYSI